MNSATSSEILFETFIHQRSSSAATANVLPSSQQHIVTSSNSTLSPTDSDRRPLPLVPIPQNTSTLSQSPPQNPQSQPTLNDPTSSTLDPIITTRPQHTNANPLHHNDVTLIPRDVSLTSPPPHAHIQAAFKTDASRNSPRAIFEQSSEVQGHFEAQISRIGVSQSNDVTSHLHGGQRGSSSPIQIHIQGRKAAAEEERVRSYRDDLHSGQNHRLLSFEDLHQINLQNLTNSKRYDKRLFSKVQKFSSYFKFLLFFFYVLLYVVSQKRQKTIGTKLGKQLNDYILL